MNSLLGVEHSPSIPIVSKAPTLILGMDVSHGSPGQTEIPSIAAVIIVFIVCAINVVFYGFGPNLQLSNCFSIFLCECLNITGCKLKAMALDI
jgi:hypothetical protein